MIETSIKTIEPDKRNSLIISRLDDIFGTIFRQIAFTSFEYKCHQSFKDKIPLSYSDFNRIWLEEIRELYGQNIEVPDYYGSDWSRIAHVFNTPFYCFTYALGNLISFGIYQGYKESDDKKAYMDKYHNFLSAGGSDRPENLIKEYFGIEIDYNNSYKIIENLIDTLNV